MPIEHRNHHAGHTYAIVLAGGRGSRLGPLTDRRSKPAVPFAGKFKIIDFTLSNCVNSGIRRVGVLTQYKAQSLIRHVERGWGFLAGSLGEFVEVIPAQQQQGERWYSGTANAVWQNLDLVREPNPRYVLVAGGDHVYKMDYQVMLAEHAGRGAAASVACIEVPLEQAREFGVMSVDDMGRVTAFDEKPERPQPVPGRPGHALVSMGIYVFDTATLVAELTRDAQDLQSSHDFGRDVIPALVRRGLVHAHRFADSCVNMRQDGEPYWRDVGTVDAYWEANIELTKVTPELNMYDADWPIWTHQEQLPPAKFVFDADDRRGMAVDTMVSGGCIISGAVVRQSVLFSNVHVREGSYLERAVVLPDVRVGQGSVLKNVVLDKGCIIPSGTTIGINPEADRKRYHVSSKGVTLVTPEMLGQDIHHFR